jgi:hypothetical protein
MVAAVLARHDDLGALHERIGQGGTFTAEELAELTHLPLELLTKREHGMVVGAPPSIIIDILVAQHVATQAVDAKVATLPWLGNPTSDLQYLPQDGYVRHYQNGSVYYTSTFGAHEVHGAIRDFYFRLGGPGSYLGLPQTDELSSGDVRYSNFQGGTIYWKDDDHGAFMTPSYSPDVERGYSTGIYLLSKGTGFTPGGRVSLWLVNEGPAPESVGGAYAGADGRFGIPDPYPFFAKFRDGDHPLSTARAIDEATGKRSDYPLSYSVL